MIDAYGGGVPGSCFVADGDRSALLREADSMPSVVLGSAAAANAVMLGAGYFHPLPGYMTADDAFSVARDMRTSSGMFWPVPCLNLCPSRPPAGSVLALRDPNVAGSPVLAVQQVSEVCELSSADLAGVAESVFGTVSEEHPGVSAFLSQGNFLVAGSVEVLNFSYFSSEFANTFRTVGQIRDMIAECGWNKVVAFQTRNPMHRAHEALCKMAMSATGADGVLIHMLLGRLKPGDIPARVRDDAIRAMVRHYFPGNSALVAGYGFDMMYAGPKEALLHAVFRQNAGCDVLIVGRDHAGVGSYYGAFEAQEIFDAIPQDALDIEIFKADHTAWSKKLGKVVMMRDAPDHTMDDYILLSGTKVREMLAAGEDLPEEFARPEVAKILMRYYQQEGG